MEASPDVPGDSVYYIDLGDEPVEVSDGDAQHILNTYPGKVEEVFRAAAVAETTEEEKAKSFFDRFRS
jgi:hypothetical protein